MLVLSFSRKAADKETQEQLRPRTKHMISQNKKVHAASGLWLCLLWSIKAPLDHVTDSDRVGEGVAERGLRVPVSENPHFVETAIHHVTIVSACLIGCCVFLQVMHIAHLSSNFDVLIEKAFE